MEALGDSNTPVYEFRYDDGTVRRTDEQTAPENPNTEGIEVLAELGRDDDECDVSLVGFE